MIYPSRKPLRALLTLCILVASSISVVTGRAASHFIEAESFKVSEGGWSPFGGKKTDPSVGPASGTKTLWGGKASPNETASGRIEIPLAGKYRLWVRYMESPFRGPFTVALQQNGIDLVVKTFDQEARSGVAPWSFEWSDFESVDIAEGYVTLELRTSGDQPGTNYTHQVDCFLLTDNLDLKPSHLEFGPQTWLRVTLGEIYDRPVYVHIFADHYRDPFYVHYAASKAGLEEGLEPGSTDSLMTGGESTGWMNISETVYEDSGALLMVSVRENYQTGTPRLQAKFEFATAPSDDAIVRVFEEDVLLEDKGEESATKPGAVNIIVPPNLKTTANGRRLILDRELAEETGKIADQFAWPTIGAKPVSYPFLVADALGSWFRRGQKLIEREQKTLDYFGFNNQTKPLVDGAWLIENDCFSQPDVPAMRAKLENEAEEFRRSGRPVEEIIWSVLTDEPTGQPLEHLAQCPACTAGFQSWLQELGIPLADLERSDWSEVKPVTSAMDGAALYFYSQKFRVHALSQLMTTQKDLIKEIYGREIPAGPNFSDGATYRANFYFQGVDYFDLLESGAQNALWSENWGNGSASRQCTTYNVELMRSAALKHNQPLGHYLIAYAERLPWDIKLNAVSQAGRDIKVFMNFWYGPTWAGHEAGPPWDTTAWYTKPYTWFSNAEVVREFGGAEDLLKDAKKKVSDVGIVYASSADIWTEGNNYAFGFDRMATWLALTHSHIPTDFLSEQRLQSGDLSSYRVLYLSGPNLNRAAAHRLVEWVKNGGTLVTSAGAASRDEYNRPLDVLDEILPAARSEVEELQRFGGSGSALGILAAKDEVVASGKKVRLDVFSVKQTLKPKAGGGILAKYGDRSPAFVRADAGKGRVYQAGFLPGLSYLQPAVVKREELSKAVGEQDKTDIPDPSKVVDAKALLRRSHCPWEYPDDIREFLAEPVKHAGVSLPVQCNVPLVDAVLMESKAGALVPLANYTLQPLKSVTLTVETDRKVARVESVHQGAVAFTSKGANRVEFSLPLQETDFVLLHYAKNE